MIRTVVLMIALMLIFMFVGNAIAGEQGMMIAFLMACAINFFSYFFSDKIVLKQYKATKVTRQSAPELYSVVSKLSQTADLPMPQIYIIPEQVPNAFATGRNPEHAAVAVTQGLLNTLSAPEIEGVLAHEMSHIKHYDILIGSISAVFAGAIAMLSNVARYNTVTSNRVSSNSRRHGAPGIIAIILMPIAATIIQMSISRTREYKADEGSARLTKHPEWLMSALAKLENFAQNYRMQNASSQTAHMFIINPFSGLKSVSSLFSTHPSTKDRLERLEKLKKEIH